MFGSQLGPEKETGFTKNTEPYGTTIVEPSTLQAASHAPSKACIIFCLLQVNTQKWKN